MPWPGRGRPIDPLSVLHWMSWLHSRLFWVKSKWNHASQWVQQAFGSCYGMLNSHVQLLTCTAHCCVNFGIFWPEEHALRIQHPSHEWRFLWAPQGETHRIHGCWEAGALVDPRKWAQPGIELKLTRFVDFCSIWHLISPHFKSPSLNYRACNIMQSRIGWFETRVSKKSGGKVTPPVKRDNSKRLFSSRLRRSEVSTVTAWFAKQIWRSCASSRRRSPNKCGLKQKARGIWFLGENSNGKKWKL